VNNVQTSRVTKAHEAEYECPRLTRNGEEILAIKNRAARTTVGIGSAREAGYFQRTTGLPRLPHLQSLRQGTVNYSAHGWMMPSCRSDFSPLKRAGLRANAQLALAESPLSANLERGDLSALRPKAQSPRRDAKPPRDRSRSEERF
jgi:hypothetical protein